MEQPTEFQLMLKKFHRTIEDTKLSKKERDETLSTLRQLAIDSAELNPRQTEAITARIDNVFNGTYGVNLKKDKFAAEQK